jgi:hypothetical protein
MGGNFRVEWVAILPWNGWQLSCGISGSFHMEWLATLPWNMHQAHDLAVSALKAAHFILIPVQPSPYDIWATSDLWTS